MQGEQDIRLAPDGRPAHVPELRQAADERLLELATAGGRTLLTNDVKDFMPITGAWARSGRHHPGVLFTSDRTCLEPRGGIGRLVSALDALMARHPADDALRSRVMWVSAQDS